MMIIILVTVMMTMKIATEMMAIKWMMLVLAVFIMMTVSETVGLEPVDLAFTLPGSGSAKATFVAASFAMISPLCVCYTICHRDR